MELLNLGGEENLPKTLRIKMGNQIPKLAQDLPADAQDELIQKLTSSSTAPVRAHRLLLRLGGKIMDPSRIDEEDDENDECEEHPKEKQVIQAKPAVNNDDEPEETGVIVMNELIAFDALIADFSNQIGAHIANGTKLSPNLKTQLRVFASAYREELNKAGKTRLIVTLGSSIPERSQQALHELSAMIGKTTTD